MVRDQMKKGTCRMSEIKDLYELEGVLHFTVGTTRIVQLDVLHGYNCEKFLQTTELPLI